MDVGFKANARAISYIEQFCKSKSLANIVTITLRDYDYDPGRNSNIEEWASFFKMVTGKKLFCSGIPTRKNLSIVTRTFQKELFKTSSAGISLSGWRCTKRQL